MILQLTPEQWQDVHAFQAREIEGLASDAEFARQASLTDHYSRVGEWLDSRAGTRVLELGCGPGRYVAMLASLGFDVVGVDPYGFPSWDIIRAHRQVELRDGIFAESLPFPDRSFDHVACLSAFLYFRDPLRALSEMRRVLKPGGRLIMRSVNRRNLHRLLTGKHIDPQAGNHYTMREFVDLLSGAGFAVRRGFSYGFYPPFMAARWWHLVNGILSVRTQAMISAVTPPQMRVNLVLFCEAPEADSPDRVPVPAHAHPCAGF